LSWHLRGASVNFDSLEVARTDIALEAERVDNDSVEVDSWAAVRTCERTSDSTTEDDLLSATVAYNTNSGDAMEEIDCAESAANLNVRLVDEFAKSFSLPRVEADAVKRWLQRFGLHLERVKVYGLRGQPKLDFRGRERDESDGVGASLDVSDSLNEKVIVTRAWSLQLESAGVARKDLGDQLTIKRQEVDGGLRNARA
jgi:hypothetical protein